MQKIKIKNLAGINLVFYSILVVLTPFIMLQNYLQGFVRHLSGVHTTIVGVSAPLVVLVFCALLIISLIVFRKLINARNLVALVVLFLLFAVGQTISDYYIDFSYYDLQNNWHYFAYFLFAFIFWSFFKQKGVSLHRILLYTWLMALAIAMFDELFQNQMSQRIFDLSDVAKDLWGTITGLVIITFWFDKKGVAKDKIKIRQPSIKEYFRHTQSTLFVLVISTFIFLIVSSLLTTGMYSKYVVLISLFLSGLVLAVVHVFRGIGKKIITILFALLIIAQAILFFANRNNNFVFHNNFLTIYKGWLLPFFDVMVFPDKTFRFVDKKVEFNNTDKKVVMKSNPDVILIGAGKNSEGGNGFPSKDETHFILNPNTKKAVQVLIFDSKTACLKYNELSNRGIKTVMVLHKSL